MNQRIEYYFAEAQKHIEHITEAKAALNAPIVDYEGLPQLEKFALNTLIFRFSKLQDLLGSKIFRTYLETMSFPVSDIGFLDILREIEKEGIVDIDTWGELRELRNDIAHDYPEEVDEMIEKINLLVSESGKLIDITITLQEKYRETQKKRD